MQDNSYSQPVESNSDKPVNQERLLWTSVITQAINDLEMYPKSKDKTYEKLNAYNWFNNADKAFREVCRHAGFNPEYVLRLIKPILQKEKDELIVYETKLQLYTKRVKLLSDSINKNIKLKDFKAVDKMQDKRKTLIKKINVVHKGIFTVKPKNNVSINLTHFSAI